MIDACAIEPQALLTVDEALAKIKTAIVPVQGIEMLPLRNSLGRILASAVYAQANIPPDRNAAMDGYAFSSQDIAVDCVFTLTCVGTSWAGRPFQGGLNSGECIRIFTGAVVPEQADSVIMQEQVRAEGSSIHFPAQTKGKQNVRLAGEDVRQGDRVCSYPKTVTAADLGLLAAIGIAEIPVLRQLKITFFSTGDELAELGQALQAGQIYDSNRYLLSGLLNDCRYTFIDGGVIADDPNQLEAALLGAAKQSDVIITTGGASVGEADYVKDILQACGQVEFWKIAMKPGKPLAFGKIGGSYLFALPGNPLAVFATFQKFVLPALAQLMGLPTRHPLRLTATCRSILKKSPGRQEFQCGILSQEATGEFIVASAGQQGSHLLSTLHKANCYIILPGGSQGVQLGEQVVVEPFSMLI
ncbi:MAG: molybdopterin molybdotransferase MoeA [Methylovulum sp.]|uniref:molybdopterin molybdotransferase MoeA n=1 Tax=Methylovulum sp. TaxID=1916980 RepID=UPI0026033FBA|nr:gephyrin-like molybdotransferase Glp [Methylovulum sp.]MDD2722490.1 molybdopterin molybdotransferase MoeA [Methylovulum sp.]MDD5126194.1 molybdopterin molybdotransferase MoeA [Methylovulum sp.]